MTLPFKYCVKCTVLFYREYKGDKRVGFTEELRAIDAAHSFTNKAIIISMKPYAITIQLAVTLQGSTKK